MILLRDHPGATPQELAAWCGTQTRYIRASLFGRAGWVKDEHALVRLGLVAVSEDPSRAPDRESLFLTPRGRELAARIRRLGKRDGEVRKASLALVLRADVTRRGRR